MLAITLQSAPCGSERFDCRALVARGAGTSDLCRLHTVWCPDDHQPGTRRVERSALQQRSFRTGG
jgi:hypothetical protein